MNTLKPATECLATWERLNSSSMDATKVFRANTAPLKSRLIQLTCLLTLVTLLVGCGGGSAGGSAPNEPVAATPIVDDPIADDPAAQPNPDAWKAVIDTLEEHEIANMVLIVGNADGEVFSYQKGALSIEESVPVASASKWLTSATILALVEQGVLTLADHPQKYLNYWSDDPQDARSQVTLEQLLSFTSGFHRTLIDPGCIGDENFTLSECAEEVYHRGLDAEPGSAFFYGPGHMQIAAAMAESASGTPWAELFHLTLVQRLNLSEATGFLGQNPRTSGNAASSAADYSNFLRALVSGEFLGSSMTTLSTPRTLTADIVSRPRASTERTDWQYGLGVWRECNERRWTDACETDQRISSPGRYGWYPWIDLKNGYYAILAMNEQTGAFDASSIMSIELGTNLHPLIIEELSSGL